MPQLSEPSRDETGVNREAGPTLAEWVESRATVLVAIGMLVLLLVVLIVVSLLHPR